MLASFKEIKWDELEEAIPAFFALFMAFCYSISYGIATGHLLPGGQDLQAGVKAVHPILLVSTLLFILNHHQADRIA